MVYPACVIYCVCITYSPNKAVGYAPMHPTALVQCRDDVMWYLNDDTVYMHAYK